MHLPHIDPLTVLAAVSAVATLLGGWLGHRIITPRDHERAAAIAIIARDAAALVVSMNPKADWATLLKSVVEQIATAAGTTNREAIERAAAQALTQLRKNPGVS